MIYINKGLNMSKEIYIITAITGEYEEYYEKILKIYEDKDKAFKFYNYCNDYFEDQFDVASEASDGWVTRNYEDEEYIAASPCDCIVIDDTGVRFRIESYNIEE